MAPSERTPKTLAEWEELDYYRRPRPMRRLKLVASFITLGATAALSLAFLLPGSKRYLQAGPVSSAHARFNDRCDLCHTDALQTVQRLWSAHSSTVSDAACTNCHAGPPHSRCQKDEEAPHCASCHQEHRGREALARVEDGRCINCHSDLAQHDTCDAELIKPFANISSFTETHPYGSIWNYGERKDPGNIKFNHRAHLALDPRNLNTSALPESFDRAFKALKEQQCNYCHQSDTTGATDREGRYMKPIQFVTHCQSCHPLWPSVVDGLDGPLQAAVNEFRRKPLPHPGPGQDGSVTLGAIRVIYLDFLAKHPNVVDGASRESARPLPGASPAPEPGRQQEWQWLNAQMTATQRALTLVGGCYQCHQKPDGESPSSLAVKPPAIPNRWLPKSIFSHAKHPKLKCVECHGKAPSSEFNTDVLLPEVKSCAECHGKQGGVRSDCLTCHGYHPLGLKRADPRDKNSDEFMQRKKD